VFVATRLQTNLLSHFRHPGFASQIQLPNEIFPWIAIQSDPGIDETPVIRTGEVTLRRKLDEEIINGKPFGGLSQTKHRTMAAPHVVIGPGDHSCSNWIERVVAHDFERVRLLLDESGIGTSLKKMSNMMMTVIEIPCVLAIQLLYSAGERRACQLHDEVKMIRHQHVRRQNPGKPPDGLS
jgi:hypothetical protein